MKFLLKISVLLALTGCGDSFLLDDDNGAGDSRSASKPAVVANYLSLGITAHLHWRTGPVIDEENTMLVVFTDESQQITEKITDLQTSIRMPEMTHGAYPITIKNIQPGVYELSEIIFFMPGLWHFKIAITTAAGTEEVIWPYTF